MNLVLAYMGVSALVVAALVVTAMINIIQAVTGMISAARRLKEQEWEVVRRFPTPCEAVRILALPPAPDAGTRPTLVARTPAAPGVIVVTHRLGGVSVSDICLASIPGVSMKEADRALREAAKQWGGCYQPLTSPAPGELPPVTISNMWRNG